MPHSSRKAEPPAAAPLRPVRLGQFDAVLEREPSGVIHVRTTQVLPPYYANLSEPLEHWAKAAPDRIFLAQRDAEGGWRTLSYAQVLGGDQTYRRVAAASRALAPSGRSRSYPATASSTRCSALPR